MIENMRVHDPPPAENLKQLLRPSIVIAIVFDLLHKLYFHYTYHTNIVKYYMAIFSMAGFKCLTAQDELRRISMQAR